MAHKLFLLTLSSLFTLITAQSQVDQSINTPNTEDSPVVDDEKANFERTVENMAKFIEGFVNKTVEKDNLWVLEEQLERFAAYNPKASSAEKAKFLIHNLELMYQNATGLPPMEKPAGLRTGRPQFVDYLRLTIFQVTDVKRPTVCRAVEEFVNAYLPYSTTDGATTTGDAFDDTKTLASILLRSANVPFSAAGGEKTFAVYNQISEATYTRNKRALLESVDYAIMYAYRL